VTGDIAGFAAATFKRGIRFAQIPTTLLAMVDASVGGKTGINLTQGKNLIGAFKQPAMVVIDPQVLTTLPDEEIRSGIVEVIKHSVIGDRALFAQLASGPSGSKIALSGVQIAQTLGVKIGIVVDDPFEENRRMVLNLGHTVGHALEKLSGFGIRHGEAIGIGMIAAAHIAADIGWADRSLAGQIKAALTAWGLPTRCPPYGGDKIWKSLAHDKKRQRYGLTWVLPRAVGDVGITPSVPEAIVKSVLREMGAR
jgi:3-dehydroquinate synthetase